MKKISVLIKPASSLCNIRCKYCFYANISSLREVKSFGKMKKDVAEKMIDNIYIDLDDGDELSIAFQGGEPTLAGLPYFQSIVDLINKQEKEVKVDFSIQTNGILINQRWCEFFKKNNFLIGLSIDGHPIYHDLNRIDPKGRGTFNKVLATKKLFDEYKIEYNVLCVLTNPLAKEAKKVFNFLIKENIQFIPCLDDLEPNGKTSYPLTPKRFASFYRTIFKLWLDQLDKGNYLSIKLFDDIINLLVDRKITACGMLGNCQLQYVIEADGSVYPCDFYVLDEFRLGFITEHSLKELFEQELSKYFICDKPQLPNKCKTCEFKKICNGGCKRMKDAMYVDQDDFCGYKNLLASILPNINYILHSLERIKI